MFYSLGRTASNFRAQLFEGKRNVDSEMQLLEMLLLLLLQRAFQGAGNVRYHTKL